MLCNYCNGKKKPSLIVDKRTERVLLHNIAFFERKIIWMVNVSKTAVSKAVTKFQILRKFMKLNRSGRPRRISALGYHG